MTFIAELDPRDPAIGGKARSLASLARAGRATPPGFVLTDDLFRALRGGAPPLPGYLDHEMLKHLDAAGGALARAPFPADFLVTLEQRLTALGTDRFSVRSSFASEDDADAVAAGVYESRTNVARAQVPDAIRAVLRSAIAPAAVAYALSRGRTPAAAPVAVLVHAYVPGDLSGAAAFDPSAPDTAPLVMVSSSAPAASSAHPAGALTPPPSAAARIDTTVRALASERGAVELEWTWRREDDVVTFLQLRPYRAPPPPTRWSGLDALPPDERDQWRWDIAHNPLPLSPAQRDLVDLVDEHCRTGLRQRVLGGYLFYAPLGQPPDRAIPPQEARTALDELRAKIEARLAQLGASPPLEATLALFLSSYEPLMGVIQPAARRGRRALEELLNAQGPEALADLPALMADVPSMASERWRLAGDRPAYLALFGDEAPVWDVAESTYAERSWAPVVRPPARVDDARWRQGLANRLLATAPASRAGLEQAVMIARACVAVGEDDDWLYARLQTAVRRALLRVAGDLVRVGALDQADDVFFWPLTVTRAVAQGSPAPPDARTLVQAGRASVAAALNSPPPGAGASPDGTLRGWGTGGRALGRVHRHDRTAPAGTGAGSVLVADTLLPTELPLMDAAAFVTEAGGPLDHVSAQARERGLPAVVGAAGALGLLAEGDLVLVDGNQGVVVKLGPRD